MQLRLQKIINHLQQSHQSSPKLSSITSNNNEEVSVPYKISADYQCRFVTFSDYEDVQ